MISHCGAYLQYLGLFSKGERPWGVKGGKGSIVGEGEGYSTHLTRYE